MPVAPETMVYIQLRTEPVEKREEHCFRASDLRWDDRAHDGDIVAFRVVTH
ncbi:hypothetical protein [Sphingobium lactosutens]|uniref:hypothetical protein n=1 Tax=Sphingobium lactosutens TaxID=522773 RepID=UPI0015BAED31|nr:hypothetical protein [Sphingobium lactosutens]